MKWCKLSTLINDLDQVHKEIKKKKQTFSWCIMYFNKWKHFCRQFLFSLQHLLVSLFFSSVWICLLSHFKIIRCIEIIDHYFNIIFVEIILKKLNLIQIFWMQESRSIQLSQMAWMHPWVSAIALKIDFRKKFQLWVSPSIFNHQKRVV